jgi:hypothetical protein
VKYIAGAEIVERACSIGSNEFKALLQHARAKIGVIARDDARTKPCQNIIEASRHTQIARAMVHFNIANGGMLFARDNINRLPYGFIGLRFPAIATISNFPIG